MMGWGPAARGNGGTGPDRVWDGRAPARSMDVNEPNFGRLVRTIVRGVIAVALTAPASTPAREPTPPPPAPKRDAGLVWTQESHSGPLLRSGAVLVYDSKRRVSVLFGGANYHRRLDDTWVWDGRIWSERSAGGVIPGLWSASGAYDSLRDRVVVFGGAERGSGLNDATFEFDGTTWAKVECEGPGTRNHLWQMAYDSRRGRVVLFGGSRIYEVDDDIVGTPPEADTWEWDGRAWRQVASGGPPPSASYGIAFDSARGVTVMLVVGAEGGAFGETWEWDGAAWRFAANSGPRREIVASMRMVYDSDRRVVVSVGCRWDLKEPEFETWEWDGVEWRELDLDPEPDPRGIYQATYDEARGRLVVVGGYSRTPEGEAGEVWELGKRESMDGLRP